MSSDDPDSQNRDADLLLEQAPICRKVRYQKLASKVINGPSKRSSAIRLACLQCVNWNQPEVNHCTIKSCALWEFRKG